MAMDNDKKKMLALGVLGAALLAVGAFQLLPKGSAPASPEKPRPKPVALASAVEGAAEDPTATLEFGPRRDPFAPQRLPIGPGQVEPAPQPTPTANYPAAQRAASAARQPRTELPPLSPLPGALPGGPGISVLPNGRPIRQPGEFAYSVVGVVVGERPVAVLQADDGTQRMIPIGGGVDGDSRVVAVEEGRVTVLHRGKRLTLPVGGNSNAK